MPKKKAGSAAANSQRPQPVPQYPSSSIKSSSTPSAAKAPPEPAAKQPEWIEEATEEAVESTKALNDVPAPTVNRKKQKRRQKQAAKLAEQEQQQQKHQQLHLNNGGLHPNGQASNGHIPYPGRGPQKGYFTEETDYVDGDYADDAVEDAFYSGEEPDLVDEQPTEQGTSRKPKKKKKNRKAAELLDEVRATSIAAANLLERSALATTQALAHAQSGTMTTQQKRRDQIWNDSKNQERENIKQFWLELGEEERKALVQIEKEAVLKKMKEQKSQCNCTVCGRKRMAIEEELEVLYDAYYDELEHYAHPSDVEDSRKIMSPRSRDHTRRQSHSYSRAPPGHFEDDLEDDEDEFDDEFDDDEDELYSDDELDEISRMPEEFYNFSNSLRVKNGILTVADDLLKNDGKEFINMMDKLADRRMQREEEARFPQNPLGHQNHHSHNHGPLDEDEYDDEEEDEDDEDYDSQDFEEDDDDMDALTEEQRMAEGRRMFQVFAARMFEQRVLTAYREKVAMERQQKLIEELEEEDRLDNQREAKKARDLAKKKEKKRLAKLAKDEEKARKEAEKAAQEAEARAFEEKKQEEQRQRKEEQRKKREAERKAQEEERHRKEAEKQRKAQQERERQADAERKQREAKEKEKKKRQEAQKKEREEREAREKEVKEQRQREERQRRSKEEEARKYKETTSKVDRDTKDKSREAEHHQARRPPVAMPPGLHHQGPSTQSPHFAVATPIIPKAPTPARPRQASQQGHSHGSSPRSQQAVTDTLHLSASPVSGLPAQTPQSSIATGKPPIQQPQLHHPQPSAPMSPLNQSGRQSLPFNYGMQGMPSGHPPPPGMVPNMLPQMPGYPGGPMGGQYRGFGFPNNMPFPPGINGRGPYPPRQGSNAIQYPVQGPMQQPGSMPQNVARDQARNQPHSRQPSGSVDRQSESSNPPQPISRPAPIGPSSTTPDKQGKQKPVDLDVENVATQLGSKALLEDSDEPLSAGSPIELPKQSTLAPGSGRVPSFPGFTDPLQKHDAFNLAPSTPQSNTWGFGTSPGASSTWGPSPPGLKPTFGPGGWPAAPNNGPAGAFGMGGAIHRPHHASRPAMIRVLAAQACQQLGSSGFHPIHTVLTQVSQIKPAHEPPIQMNEVLEILDTEGNHQNGGGTFSVRGAGAQTDVRFDPEDSTGAATSAVANAPGGPTVLGRGLGVGGLGDIGSPVMGQGQMYHHPPGFGGIGSSRT